MIVFSWRLRLEQIKAAYYKSRYLQEKSKCDYIQDHMKELAKQRDQFMNLYYKAIESR